jgi:hypothetical protein
MKGLEKTRVVTTRPPCALTTFSTPVVSILRRLVRRVSVRQPGISIYANAGAILREKRLGNALKRWLGWDQSCPKGTLASVSGKYLVGVSDQHCDLTLD